MKKSKQKKTQEPQKPIFTPQHLRGNPFKASGSGAKFNPATFKTQHKG